MLEIESLGVGMIGDNDRHATMCLAQYLMMTKFAGDDQVSLAAIKHS